MADEPKARPFVLQWRSAVLNSTEPATRKLVLLCLAEFAESSGNGAEPAMRSIGILASLEEKAVGRQLSAAAGRWFTQNRASGRGKDWRTSKYVLTIPDGADSRSARERFRRGQRADAESGPSEASSRLSGQMVPTLKPDGADAKSNEVGVELGIQVGTATAAIPLKDGTLFTLSDQLLAEIEAAYPGQDVLQELQRMRAWALGNPGKRKTRTGALKFVTGWMSRKQDRAKTSTPSVADDFRRVVYIGSPLEDLPESLRPLP